VHVDPDNSPDQPTTKHTPALTRDACQDLTLARSHLPPTRGLSSGEFRSFGNPSGQGIPTSSLQQHPPSIASQSATATFATERLPVVWQHTSHSLAKCKVHHNCFNLPLRVQALHPFLGTCYVSSGFYILEQISQRMTVHACSTCLTKNYFNHFTTIHTELLAVRAPIERDLQTRPCKKRWASIVPPRCSSQPQKTWSSSCSVGTIHIDP
jgi:hypothetical protein